MPGVSQAIFVAMNLSRSDIEGKSVLDVGSRNYNGSVKPLIEHWKPSLYVGIDLTPGRDVDLVLPAENIVNKFGAEYFDIVISLEMLEHSEMWRDTISNMKRVLKPHGILILTTRSEGYPVHGFPHDFWRFSCNDLSNVFSDMETESLQSDPDLPGSFIKVRKPEHWKESDLSHIALYSVLTGERNFFTTEYFRTSEIPTIKNEIFSSKLS